MKKMFGATYLYDQRGLMLEEQLSCHPPFLIWVWHADKNQIFLPLNKIHIFPLKIHFEITLKHRQTVRDYRFSVG